MHGSKICILTFDIEEWFQVENLKSAISRESWPERVSSVQKNTERILQILSDEKICATFFVLGWVAKTHPELLRLIVSLGHEVASHGDLHEMTNNLTDKELRRDILHSKNTIENVTSQEIRGYRAPNFSVSDRLLEILIDLGYEYDSSYNPVTINRRYGSIQMKTTKTENALLINDNFFEIPISSLRLASYDLPIAGGAYFRLIPFRIFRSLVQKKLEVDEFYNFYLHPWEFEPEQPRIKNIKLNHKIRHYTGLSDTENKFKKFIQFLKNNDCMFLTMDRYISDLKAYRISK